MTCIKKKKQSKKLNQSIVYSSMDQALNTYSLPINLTLLRKTRKKLKSRKRSKSKSKKRKNLPNIKVNPLLKASQNINNNKYDALKIAEDLIAAGFRVFLLELPDKDPSEMGFRTFTKLIQSATELDFKKIMLQKLDL